MATHPAAARVWFQTERAAGWASAYRALTEARLVRPARREKLGPLLQKLAPRVRRLSRSAGVDSAGAGARQVRVKHVRNQIGQDAVGDAESAAQLAR